MNHQPRSVNEARDIVQHHIVAALAQQNDERLVFKGGTMLRTCVFPGYRYSEDLDFDWFGTPGEFQEIISESLGRAEVSLNATVAVEDTDLSILVGRGPNPRVAWYHQGHGGQIRTEATFSPEYALEDCEWSVLHNYPGIPPGPPIIGYTLVSVMADKISCVSRRAAARDFYDMYHILQVGVDIHDGWSLYVCNFQNPRSRYGRRTHPINIRSSYMGGRRSLVAEDWTILVQNGLLPDTVPLDDAIACVDGAIQEALELWMGRMSPEDIRQLREESQ